MELAEIAKVFQAAPPVLSVYVDAPHVEDVRERVAVKWKDLRRDLTERGADEATLAALAGAVLDPHLEGHGFAGFAGHGQVLWSRRLPEPVPREVALPGPLPYVLPLLAWRQRRLPYVVVIVDRTGADIYAYSENDVPVDTEKVQGSHDVIHRVQAGGWSQLKYQHRAIDSWRGNAAEAADDIDRAARSVNAELVLVGGDANTLHFLRDYLPEALRPKVVVLEHAGARTPGSLSPYLEEEVGDRVADAAKAGLLAVFEKFEEERGQHDRAADGLAATVAALQKAQVATLLVTDDLNDSRTLSFGPDATLLATGADDLRALGVESPQEARAADVLVRAAVGTGADVVVVGPDDPVTLPEGVGAILRYPDA
ncbi:MAG: hypothetical protein QOE45_2416 [Frankiaceae bacterium]|jgi:hypothetical protein|nr:hypothetical protein [Frankiaceae bacterium]